MVSFRSRVDALNTLDDLWQDREVLRKYEADTKPVDERMDEVLDWISDNKDEA